MDDGCVADFTTDYRNFSDVGTFYWKKLHGLVGLSLWLLMKIDFWPEHNHIMGVEHYCVDDGCFVDTTMDFWKCSDIGMFSEKLYHKSFTFSLWFLTETDFWPERNGIKVVPI